MHKYSAIMFQHNNSNKDLFFMKFSFLLKEKRMCARKTRAVTKCDLIPPTTALTETSTDRHSHGHTFQYTPENIHFAGVYKCYCNI